MIRPKAVSHLTFILKLLLLSLISDLVPAESARSSSSVEVVGVGGTGTGSSSTSQASSSLIPSSTHHYRDRGDRELISAQFRASHPHLHDARDLDTSESTITGIETLSAAAAAAALEDEHLNLSKYMAASASTYSPSKMRLNRYSQTGFYDPYPVYPGSFPSNVPSSYYPYNAYNYRDSNPMLDTYPYYERDRLRELKERAMQASQSAPFSSTSASSHRDGFGGGSGGSGSYYGGYRDGYREGYRSNNEHDSLPMSSGHGSHENHGHGWGWGNHFTSKVNTNAIGLLGLLGLLSLLSNVLLQFTTTTTTTTAAMGGRKKRSVNGEDGALLETKEQKRERIFMELLPYLTPIAHASDGLIPVDCTYQGICMANKVLVNELGFHGRTAGQRISSAVVKLLDKAGNDQAETNKTNESAKRKNKLPLYSKKQTSFKKALESAGLHGRNKMNCEKSYPVCSSLQKNKSRFQLPFIIRMQDLPQLISKVSSLTKEPGTAWVPLKL